MFGTAHSIQLRSYEEEDRAFFKELFTDVSVMQHVDGALTPARADALFTSVIDGSSTRVVRAFVAEVPGGDPVGHGALLRDPSREGVEIGYLLAPRFWGCGIATQIAHRLVRIAQGELGYTSIFATVDADHGASIRVLEKVGFELVQRIPDRPVDVFVYALPQPGRAQPGRAGDLARG